MLEVVGFHHLVRNPSGLLAGLTVHLAHETLHGGDGLGGVGDGLTLGGVSDFAFAVCYEGHHRWCGSLAFAVVDDHRLVAFHYGNTRIGCAEVDTDDFAHMRNL